MKKRRTKPVADTQSRGPTPSQVIGDWQAVVQAAVYQPRPIAGFPKSTTKKTASKK